MFANCLSVTSCAKCRFGALGNNSRFGIVLIIDKWFFYFAFANQRANLHNTVKCTLYMGFKHRQQQPLYYNNNSNCKIPGLKSRVLRVDGSAFPELFLMATGCFPHICCYRKPGGHDGVARRIVRASVMLRRKIALPLQIASLARVTLLNCECKWLLLLRV